MRAQWVCALAAICLAAGSAGATGPSYETLEVDFGKGPTEGMALLWSNDAVHLLGRDGRIWEFAPRDAKSLKKVAPRFQSYPAADMRAQLQRELGPSFEITSTGHYLVAHPRGQRDKWAERFEQLYRSFVHYFSVRGLTPQAPPFPMVAIVWPTQADFLRYAAAEGMHLPSNVLGYYSIFTNRIALFDQGDDAAAKRGADWGENAATIVHEAMHQSAFNTGLHSRFVSTPRWLAEGLGTLFEAPGVWNAKDHPSARDRLNQGRLANFKDWVQGGKRREGFLAEMVTSDRVFDADPIAAYAEAWALTYYLVETRPKQYFNYLKATASKPAYSAYSGAERLKDFQDAFGADLRKLEADFLRYMATVDGRR